MVCSLTLRTLSTRTLSSMHTVFSRVQFAIALAVVLLLGTSPSASLAETVLLDFSSPSCGPCQQMRPTIQRLAADGFQVQEIDISRDPQTAARFGVTQVPTFIIMVDDQPVDRLVGATSYRQLHRMMRRATPAVAPRRPARVLGQSPTTFAPGPAPSQAATVAPIAAGSNTRPAAQNLYEPQPNRIVSLQDPNTTPTRPAANNTANPFGNTPTRPVAGAPGSLSNEHARLLAATVKITVADPQGKSAGTGTIIDARSGEALVLTCGHIFRSSAGKGPITITTFQPGPTGATSVASYTGNLIDFDLERDLALVSMRPTSLVQAIPVAPRQLLQPNTPVTSVGCNHGQNPTAIDSRVTTLNRYQGSPNVEVAGAPVEGRSGGGLFANGQLVGVCFAADPQSNEGLYASIPSIHAKLDSLRLTMIYQPNGAASPAVAEIAAPPQPVRPDPSLAIRGQEPETPQPTASPAVTSLPLAEQAALAEIQRRGINSEVICIIRPKNPSGKSEVITLNNMSPAFVQALANPASQGDSQASAAEAAGRLLR